MLRFTPKTIDALKANQVCLFVHFDFQFLPMRVHSGRGTIEWDGHNWRGIGDVLRKNSASSPFSMSSTHYNRGGIAASLPVDTKTREVLAHGYFQGRRMKWSMCSLDQHGNVIEQVHQNEGIIVECCIRDNLLNFRADFDLLDSTAEKDAQHKSAVEAVRKKIKSDIGDSALSGGVGWFLNVCLAASGQALGLLLDLLSKCISRSAYRQAIQRWEARKRVYWFSTEPKIPGLRLRKNGYKIRADTLDEAKLKLYAKAAQKVWEFPRGCIIMFVYLDRELFEMLNLDHIRQRDDRQRWRETDPIVEWGRVSDTRDCNGANE